MSPAPTWSVVPLLIAATLSVPAPAVAASTIGYVALGDSYSSGVGTPDEAGSCGRSPSGYPSLWTANHPTAVLSFAACGGATTDTVLSSQLSALTTATKLVSITIGGNDAGFFPTVIACASNTETVCEQQVTSARSYMAQVLPGKLDATYQAIRKAAPNATVVVLGYPRLFEPTADCAADGMTTFKRQVLNAAADHLARVIADRAQAAGFTYADVRGNFAGHAVCTAVPWVNNFSTTRQGDSLHPNTPGYAQGYLPALSAAASAVV